MLTLEIFLTKALCSKSTFFEQNAKNSGIFDFFCHPGTHIHIYALEIGFHLSLRFVFG